jgi:hypothetical protein
MINSNFANRVIPSLFAIFLLINTSASQDYWKRNYGGQTITEANAITMTPDSNYLVVGSTYANGNRNAYLLKIKPNGDTLWTRSYGGIRECATWRICSAGSGNFIAIGYTRADNGNIDIFLLKISGKGDTLWSKSYDFNADAEIGGISPTKDGNYLPFDL